MKKLSTKNNIYNYTYAGGGGYYGGNSGYHAPGGGGSGYIGNSLLTSKTMYCYQCQESNSDDENIKTISTTKVSSNPVSEYAKIGNGYVKITYLGEE